MRINSVNWNSGLTTIVVCVIATLIFLSPAAASAHAVEFTPSQIEMLTGKAIGENRSDPTSIACVMRNRLEGGWSPRLVHTAFYAPWVAPTRAQAEALSQILKGNGDCNTDAWYAWSTQDVSLIRPRSNCFLFESAGTFYYAKCALWR